MSLLENNFIELNVGDVYRLNGARKKQLVISTFSHDGGDFYVVKDTDKSYGYEVVAKQYLTGVYNYYGNVWSGIAELNDKKVRGTGGKLLAEPKDVVKTTKKVSKNDE